MEMNKETNGSKQSKKEDVVSQRPKRIVKRNRRFLDSDMWINSPSSASSPTASASMGSKGNKNVGCFYGMNISEINLNDVVVTHSWWSLLRQIFWF